MKYFTTSHWLVVVLISLIVGVLLGGGIIYFWSASNFQQSVNTPAAIQNNSTEQVVVNTLNNTINDTKNAANTPANQTSTSSVKVPVSWLSFKDAASGVSFSYPDDWGEAKVEKLKADGDFSYLDVDTSHISFDQFKSRFGNFVNISSLSDYQALDNTSPEALDAKTLLSVYRNRSVGNHKNPLWLPSINAAITYNTYPQYIENASGTYRGIYYFGFITQNDIFHDKKTVILPSLIMILTDGQDNVVQFSYTDPQINNIGDWDSLDTVAAKNCFTSTQVAKSCEIDQASLDMLKDSFSIIADSLK